MSLALNKKNKTEKHILYIAFINKSNNLTLLKIVKLTLSNI